jgi:hypothetical protein
MAQGAGGQVHPPALRKRREGLLGEAWIIQQRQLRAIRIDADQIEMLAPAQTGQGLGPGDRLEQRFRLRAVRRTGQRVDVEITLVADAFAKNVRAGILKLQSVASANSHPCGIASGVLTVGSDA